MMPRDYINHSGGDATVNELIGLSPSNHGTTNPLAPYAVGCVACQEQVYNSPYIQYVNTPTETKNPVDYTVIETKYDEVVTPYTSAFLRGRRQHPGHQRDAAGQVPGQRRRPPRDRRTTRSSSSG